MMLLTKALLKRLTKLGETEHQSDPTVWVKLFYPDFSWTWYVLEFDGDDVFFGYVDAGSPYSELGYFRLSELQENRGKFGCTIERDRSFRPCRLSEIVQRGQSLAA